MKKETSLYLDAVRFCAALAVVLTHFSDKEFSGGLLWQLHPYGIEAVIIFFVLSGYVIAFATDTREKTMAAYSINRMARVYSVAIPAILLTALLDQAGQYIRPDAGGGWGYAHATDYSFSRFFSGLTFTNELWGNRIRQGSNVPYWSMGYEVPYYVLFGIALFCANRWRAVAICAALAIIGPYIVQLLPVWASGVFAYRVSKGDSISPKMGIFLFLGSTLAWITYECLAWRFGRSSIQPSVWINRPEIVQDYVVGVLFTLNLIGFNAAAKKLGVSLLRYADTIRWLAGATFSLYLFHFPIMQFLVVCMPWPSSDSRSRVIVFSLTLVLVFLLAMVTERKKEPWRRAIESIWRSALIKNRAHVA